MTDKEFISKLLLKSLIDNNSTIIKTERVHDFALYTYNEKYNTNYDDAEFSCKVSEEEYNNFIQLYFERLALIVGCHLTYSLLPATDAGTSDCFLVKKVVNK